MKKFQFRAVPPNTDIVLDNAGQGYRAMTEEAAWQLMKSSAAEPSTTMARLQTRYTIEEFKS